MIGDLVYTTIVLGILLTMLFIIVSDQYEERVWLTLLSETLLLWHTPVSTLTAIMRMGRMTSSTVL